MALITLVSNDGQNFQVERKSLKHSGTIENLIVELNLDRPDADLSALSIPIRDVRGEILEKVIEWMRQHGEDPVEEEDDDDRCVETIVPDWDRSFLQPFLNTSTILEIANATSALKIKQLLNYACKVIADSAM